MTFAEYAPHPTSGKARCCYRQELIWRMQFSRDSWSASTSFQLCPEQYIGSECRRESRVRKSMGAWPLLGQLQQDGLGLGTP